MVPLPPLRDGGCALPICPFGRACLPLISDAPDCKCSPGRLWFLGDGHERTVPLRHGNFNPRAPCGARPGCGRCPPCRSFHFNPRAPCGARRYIVTELGSITEFQSTRPVWGATYHPRKSKDRETDFNPRAPCGARRIIRASAAAARYFNPRAPCGARHLAPDLARHGFQISIHAPRVGRDQ